MAFHLTKAAGYWQYSAPFPYRQYETHAPAPLMRWWMLVVFGARWVSL